MSSSGFWVTRLTLSGPGQPDATLELVDGLNVITGPSDTGKTFAAQCMNFMFGGSEPPKGIPEADGYTTITMELTSRGDGRTTTLERGLKGGAFAVRAHGSEPAVLGESHQSGQRNTVSYFLLELSGLADKVILKKKETGSTRELSFRDVARFVIVDEETVISERSPVTSGQWVTKTAETSTFRLLLTGRDDKGIHERPTKSDIKVQGNARDAVVAELRVQVETHLAKVPGTPSREDALQRLSEIDLVQAELSSMLNTSRTDIGRMQAGRQELWSRLRAAQSQREILSELRRRFELLDAQYRSDVARLEAIVDAQSRLRQLPEVDCPECGALPQDQKRRIVLDPSIEIACTSEIAKIGSLLTDLSSTLAANQHEMDELQCSIRDDQASLDTADSQLKRHLEPRVKDVLGQLQEILAERDALVAALAFYDRLDELAEFSAAYAAEETVQPAKVVAKLPTTELDEFCLQVGRLLSEWHFPGHDRVTFSEDDLDLVVDGRRRASHGKGVRALTHAAFNLGLLQYCELHDLPHPGVVIIDSPLVVYREPDTDESGIAPDVKDSFYRSLAQDNVRGQMLIIENEDPPRDMYQRDANVIEFTGTRDGRRGFIPTRD